jgi:hypothetical protein
MRQLASSSLLPDWRYRPAEIDGRKVAELVEQPFTFDARGYNVFGTDRPLDPDPVPGIRRPAVPHP